MVTQALGQLEREKSGGTCRKPLLTGLGTMFVGRFGRGFFLSSADGPVGAFARNSSAEYLASRRF